MFRNACAVFILALAVMLLMVSAGRRARPARRKVAGPLGIVVLQFDDSTAGHFTHAFRFWRSMAEGSSSRVGQLGKPGS